MLKQFYLFFMSEENLFYDHNYFNIYRPHFIIFLTIYRNNYSSEYIYVCIYKYWKLVKYLFVYFLHSINQFNSMSFMSLRTYSCRLSSIRFPNRQRSGTPVFTLLLLRVLISYNAILCVSFKYKKEIIVRNIRLSKYLLFLNPVHYLYKQICFYRHILCFKHTPISPQQWYHTLNPSSLITVNNLRTISLVYQIPNH